MVTSGTCWVQRPACYPRGCFEIWNLRGIFGVSRVMSRRAARFAASVGVLHDSPPVEVRAWSERSSGPIKYVKVIANTCTFTNVHMNNVQRKEDSTACTVVAYPGSGISGTLLPFNIPPPSSPRR